MSTQATEKTSDADENVDQQRRHLTRLRIEGFQDHKDTTLDLKPGINLVTGTSDAGKSASLRAFNLLMHNQPQGDSFIQLGQKEAIVTGLFSDGVEIQRIKGDRNIITVEFPDDREDIHKANFGKDYPEEVLDALGNPPFDKEHGALAYCEQMAKLFLVSLTPTALARTISELMGIDDYEEAAKKCASAARQASRQIKEGNERVKTADKELLKYADLDDRLEELQTIEQKAVAIERLAEKAKIARELHRRGELILSQAKEAKTALSKVKRVALLKPSIQPIKDLAEEAAVARGILKRHEAVQAEEAETRETIKNLERLTNPKLKKSVSSAKELLSTMKICRDLVAAQAKLDAEKARIEAEEAEWTKTHADAVAERDALVAEMIADGMWCDNCNRPLVEDTCGRA